MGSGTKNKKKAGMGDYVPTPEQREAMRWCINNYIKMYPVPSGKEWKVGIQLGKGKENLSPEAYGPGDIWKQMFEYYEYYHVKYREQTDK